MTVIRSCVLPGRRHDEVQHDAYACPRCCLKMVRQLADIETYLTIVTPAPGRGEPGPRASGYESRPPLDLAIVAMLDWRTEINGSSGLTYPDGEDDVLDEIPNVWADLDGWSRIVREEHPDHPGGAGAWYLRAWCSWICRQPWVDECAADITRVHAALRRACRDVPEGGKGHCISILANGTECGAEVYSTADYDGVRCSSCRRLYTGLDLARLHVAQRPGAA
jgi:hypothetical protein